MPPLLCQQPDLLLALGIVSAPDYHGRRMAARHSWMRWPSVGQRATASTCAQFIVRAGGAPIGTLRALRREAKVHGDTLLVQAIAHNESRVRGPLLSLAWWLLYAASALRHATFIGKLDDDAYLHAPDLERLLRTTHAQLGPTANVYMGVLTWYHWYSQLFDNTRHGWSYQQGLGAGRWCRNHPLSIPGACGAANASTAGQCGACEGPFAFAAGYLVVCSFRLVDSLARRGSIFSEAARLRALGPRPLNKQGARPHARQQRTNLRVPLRASSDRGASPRATRALAAPRLAPRVRVRVVPTRACQACRSRW